MSQPRRIEGKVVRIHVAVGEASACDIIVMVQPPDLTHPVVVVQAIFKGDYDPMKPLSTVSGQLRLTMPGDEIIFYIGGDCFIEEISRFANLTLENL